MFSENNSEGSNALLTFLEWSGKLKLKTFKLSMIVSFHSRENADPR